MNQPLNTSAIDLARPRNRFAATSQLHSHLHRYQLLLARYWWIPVLIFTVVLVPVYVLTAGAPPTFKSEAKMWLTGKLNLSEGRVYNEDLINFVATQGEVLRSPVIRERALAHLPRSNPPPRVVSKGLTGAAQSARDRVAGAWRNLRPPKETPAEDLPIRLDVREAAKSSIIELGAFGREPESTRAFLDNLMAEYLEFKREMRAKTSDRALASVSDQVSQLTMELEAQQEKMHAFQMSNNVVLLQEQGSSAGSYLAFINKQLAFLRTELQLLQTLQPEQFMEIGSKPRGNPSDEPLPGEASAKELVASMAGSQTELFKARQQINLLKLKRDEFSQFLRPTHPKIVKLNGDIAIQEKLAEVSRDESLKRLANRRHAVELEIQNLEKASAEWDVKTLDASRKMSEYQRIRHGLDRLQAAYDRLLGVIQTVDVSKTLDQENVGIMEPASIAAPVNHTVRNMLLGTSASLFLTFGFLYLMAAFDNRFASVHELRNHFSESIAGQIPEIRLWRHKGKVEMEALEKTRFEFVEAFRSIRSSLLFTGNGQPRPKSILITSSVPKEGKSTVSLYLAATMAMGGSRVLLVDADMRRASLHKYFGVLLNPGLAGILDGETLLPPREPKPEAPDGAEVVEHKDPILNTTIANLHFLPAGQARRNPGELVLSPRWESFLQDVAFRFDYILVDTPPILATDDASGLAQKVDGVLMVIRGSFTSAQVAREALDSFHQRKANIVGLIFNRALGTGHLNYCYQQYKHDYRWRPPQKRSRWRSNREHKHAPAR